MSFFDYFKSRDGYYSAVMKDEVLKDSLMLIYSSRIIQIIKECNICKFVFDKNNPTSLLNLINSALHPVITQCINNVGIINLNINYVDEVDDLKMCDCLYSTLNAVLLYYFELSNIIVDGLLDQSIS